MRTAVWYVAKRSHRAQRRAIDNADWLPEPGIDPGTPREKEMRPRPGAYIHACTYLHTYIDTYIHTYRCIRMYLHIYTYILTSPIHTYVCIHTCAYVAHTYMQR